MRALTVDLQQATGRFLCSTIFRPSGKKLLAKGHQLTDEDVRLLVTEGLSQVWVAELEAGEISEDDAVLQMDLSITLRVMVSPLSDHFKLSILDPFDETQDHFDQLDTFKTTLLLQLAPNEIPCHAFPMTLKGDV